MANNPSSCVWSFLVIWALRCQLPLRFVELGSTKISWGKSCSFCIWGCIVADSQKTCKKSVTHSRGFINLLFHFKLKEYSRWHISHIFNKFRHWIVSLVLCANGRVWQWATNELNTSVANTTNSSFFSIQIEPQKLLFQIGYSIII